MEKIYYLVCAMWFIKDSSGDHITCLFDSYDEAKTKFYELTDDVRKKILDKTDCYYREYYDEDVNTYSIVTHGHEIKVDVWVQTIKPDGTTRIIGI